MNKESKIYVAGHKGLVGSAIYRQLIKDGYKHIIVKTHLELDLTNQSLVNKFFEKEKPEYVFLAAAKVGGIMANYKHPTDFIYENMMIEFNVINACFKNNVKRLLYLGSSCIYPKDAPQPIKEEYLLTGSLENTNEGYALAKISGLKYIEYLNKEYHLNYVSLMPTNLYGINDNYDLETSHVIPALIRKIHEAKINNIDVLELYGTGKPLREFMFSDDLAKISIRLMNMNKVPSIINIGSGEELTINDLALLIKKIVGYSGKITFNSNYPDGVYRKRLDLSVMKKLKLMASVKLKDGLKIVYKDYLNHVK